MSKKKEIDVAFLERTIEVLKTAFDEYDIYDAHHDEGLLRAAFSSLMEDGYIGVTLKGFGLRDLVGEVLGEQASDDLVYRAETFDNLLDTYGGEPSDEDMEEAYEYFGEILDNLKSKLERVKKRKDKQQERLWKNC
jgi:hypothetical protein